MTHLSHRDTRLVRKRGLAVLLGSTAQEHLGGRDQHLDLSAGVRARVSGQ